MKPTKMSMRRAIASLLFLLVTACGGGGSSGGDSSSGGSNGGSATGTKAPAGGIKLQIVSFGDSLSDVGTYAPIAEAADGGRFTTNPGQVWTQDVAQYYGNTLTAAYTIGFTQKLTAEGGYGYAEGGATVATPVSGFLVDVIGNVEMPVTDQVNSYLKAHTTFNGNQLVLVWGGANDVLRAGALPGSEVPVKAAANTLAQVVAQIVQAGATHVVVVNIPNVGATPKGIASADSGATLTQLSQIFNTTLNSALQTNGMSGKVISIDAYTWMNQVIADYKADGFVASNTAQACDPNSTPDDTSLLCSPSTYVSANADQTYIFADDLHFATRMHLLFAQLVEQEIAKTGLGH